MAVLSKLRQGLGRGIRRQDASNTQTFPSTVAEEIASVTFDPNDYAVERAPQTRTSQSLVKKPWHNLENFILFIEDRGRRIRLVLFRKRIPRTSGDVGDTLASEDPSPQVTPVPIFAETGVGQSGESNTHPVAQNSIYTNADLYQLAEVDENGAKSQAAGLPSNSVFVVEGHEYKGIPPNLDLLQKNPQTTLAPAASRGPEISRTVQRSSKRSSTRSIVHGPINYWENKGASDETVQGYQPPPAPADCGEFTTSAIIVIDGDGEKQSTKLLYDTGTTGNWVTEKFMREMNLTPHPVRSEDLKMFKAMSGENFTPLYYGEVRLSDRSMGIKDFISISGYLTADEGRYGVIVGRGFINEHGIAISPVTGRDMYVTASGKPSAAAVEEHRKLLAQTKKERQEYLRLIASTAGPSTAQTGPSQDGHIDASSRTSTSSNAQSSVKKV